MKSTILVDGVYPLVIEPPTTIKPGSYFQFAAQPKHFIMNARCWRDLFMFLQPEHTDFVVEWFGGLGICATMVREILKPNRHFIMDLNDWKHLKRRFPGAVVRHGDAFKKGWVLGDLLILDIQTSTLLHGFDKLRRAFEAGVAKRIIVTDTAINKFHLNMEAYNKRLPFEITSFKDYCRAYDCATSAHGYTLQRVAYHNGSAKLLFGRTAQFGRKDFEMIDVRKLPARSNNLF